MLKTLQIANMRRFGSPGRSIDLGQITVIVGPNSSGKSTLIDAIMLACSATPEEALGQIVRRRVGLSHAARWLIHQPEAGPVEIDAVFDDPSSSKCVISRSTAAIPPLGDAWTNGPTTTLDLRRTHSSSPKPATSQVAFDGRNDYRRLVAPIQHPSPGAWLLDTKLVRDDEEDVAALFSEIVAADVAQRRALIDRLKRAIPAMERLTTLDVLLNADRKGYVAFGNGSGPLLPVAAMGDGGRLVFRIALDAARVRTGSVFLIEEPELHQHPVAITELGALLGDLARSGIQVVISTHSPLLLSRMVSLGARDQSPIDVAVVAMGAGGGAPTVETIAGPALRTEWIDFKKAHLTAFDASSAGI